MVFEIEWIKLRVAGQHRLRSAMEMSHQAMSNRNKGTGRVFDDPIAIFTICVK